MSMPTVRSPGRVGAAHQGRVPRAVLRALLRSGVRGGGARARAGVREGVGRLRRHLPQVAAHRAGRTRATPIPTMALPVEWVRTKAAIAAAERRQKDPVVADPHPARQRLDAQPAHLPGRDLEDAASRAARAAGDRVAARARGRRARRLGAGRRAAQGDLPVQGVRLHRTAALPLAVLVLSEPRARPDQRLDGRALPALGGGARRVHRLPGALVSRAGEPEADDRPPGVRRRRQPRLHQHRRQGSGEGQGARARRLGLSQAPGGPRLRGRGPRRRRRSREPAADARRLAHRHRHGPGGPGRGARHVDRLVSPVCDQPRRPRRRHRPLHPDRTRRPQPGGDDRADPIRRLPGRPTPGCTARARSRTRLLSGGQSPATIRSSRAPRGAAGGLATERPLHSAVPTAATSSRVVGARRR